ncbi:hypothetical protein, partial [Streptomyces triculaminicus]|uniref:hypothetical protein n=1 Tax=Streptomyces triculaminicus TaxID=2816232 RepID=UPI00378C2FD0
MNTQPDPIQFGRPFVLQRDHDVTGVSGTGIVADGVLWPDGTVSVRWRGSRPSTVHWDRLDDAIAVHGHGGATRIVWQDTPSDSVRIPTDTNPTCKDTLSADNSRTPSDTDLTDLDTLRGEYAAAIRAHSWA